MECTCYLNPSIIVNWNESQVSFFLKESECCHEWTLLIKWTKYLRHKGHYSSRQYAGFSFIRATSLMKSQLLSTRISHSLRAASLMVISILNRHHSEVLNKRFCLSGNITLQKKMKLSIESCANARDYNIQIFQMQGKILCRWARPSEIRNTNM